MDLHEPVADDLDRRLGQLVHLHEPLQRDQRLDPLAGALRVRDAVDELLGADDAALGPQRVDDRLARFEHGHAREALAGGVGHQAVLADDRDLLEPVRAADLEVVRVVPGRDLERAGAELGLDVVVGDDLQAAADERQDRPLADQPRVAVVVGVHGDRRVGEHRLRAHGRDRQRPAAALERVVDVVERVGDLALLDLEVGDRRVRPGVPVDHVVVAVDQALVVEVDEDLLDRARVRGIEREALVLVVAGGAEALELLDDRGAVLVAPAPDALDERLAADLLAARALRLEQALDLGLRRDARMVGAEDPLRPLPTHARETDQRVLHRAVERVAHVQRPGDVRQWDRDRVVVGGVAGRLRVEQPGLEPAREHARLRLGGVVSRAVLELFAHRAEESRSAGNHTTSPDELHLDAYCHSVTRRPPRTTACSTLRGRAFSRSACGVRR
jgi:hypothetical protein